MGNNIIDEKSKITVEEMVKMRLEGKSYEEIARASGIARQNVHKRISRYCRREILGASNDRIWIFPIEEIAYEGVYQWFKNNPSETLSSFNRNTIGKTASTMSCFLKGGKSYYSIEELHVICRYIGKPFEEVFKKR